MLVTFQGYRPVITKEFVELRRKLECIAQRFGMDDQLAHNRESAQTTRLFVKTDMFVLGHHPEHLDKTGILFRRNTGLRLMQKLGFNPNVRQ